MLESINPLPYIRLPRVDVANGLSLGRMLLTLVPEAAPPTVQKAAESLRVSVTSLEDTWKQRVRIDKLSDLRPLDRKLDLRWRALYSRIVAWKAIDGRPEKQARADELFHLLFSDGLAFLKLPYVAEHAESQRRLDVIVERNLEPTINDLAGPEFLAAVREAHLPYGETLGITKAGTARIPGPSLAEPLRQLTEAIAVYNIQLIAYAAHDPSALTAVRTALSPVDKFREALSRRGSDQDDEDEVEPTPGEVPGEPALSGEPARPDSPRRRRKSPRADAEGS